jgi:hypothetical protein
MASLEGDYLLIFSTRMKSGLIREVTFGERGLIKRFTTSPPL